MLRWLERMTAHDAALRLAAGLRVRVWRALAAQGIAADRTPDICQSQSVNIFLPGDVEKWDLHMLHWQAWERGCKSLYYLRSKSVQRAAHAGGETQEIVTLSSGEKTDYEECLACQ